MTARWRRRIDPTYPYRAERAQGADTWLSAAVACYSAAWQLLVPSFVVLLVVRGMTSAGPAWWCFMPSIASAAAGAWCALSHHLKDDVFRWWSPWTLLVPAGSGLAYAVGHGRSTASRRSP